MIRYDLEERLIDHACAIINLLNQLPNNTAGRYLRDQLTRSSLSSALNYGEAISAESTRDFIHKNRVILKELRESSIALRVIERLKLTTKKNSIKSIGNENKELIAIFQATINTAIKNQNTRSK